MTLAYRLNYCIIFFLRSAALPGGAAIPWEMKVKFMILVTRLNGTPLMLNEDFIEAAEETPDTVVTMMNGHRYILKEKLDEIIEKSFEFRRRNGACNE